MNVLSLLFSPPCEHSAGSQLLQDSLHQEPNRPAPWTSQFSQTMKIKLPLKLPSILKMTKINILEDLP